MFDAGDALKWKKVMTLNLHVLLPVLVKNSYFVKTTLLASKETNLLG